MRPAPLAPAVHFFVCANRRPPDSPLGAGCGDAGEAVYAALKEEVAGRGAYRTAWVTQTLCLGVCPKRGCTLAMYPRQKILSEVEPSDAAALFDAALAEARA
jgi:(2Fe-2S) ferredoxin